MYKLWMHSTYKYKISFSSVRAGHAGRDYSTNLLHRFCRRAFRQTEQDHCNAPIRQTGLLPNSAIAGNRPCSRRTMNCLLQQDLIGCLRFLQACLPFHFGAYRKHSRDRLAGLWFLWNSKSAQSDGESTTEWDLRRSAQACSPLRFGGFET